MPLSFKPTLRTVMSRTEELLRLLHDALPPFLDLASSYAQHASSRPAAPELDSREGFYTKVQFELQELRNQLPACREYIGVSTAVTLDERLREALRKALGVLNSRVDEVQCNNLNDSAEYRKLRGLIERRPRTSTHEPLRHTIKLASQNKAKRQHLVRRLKELNFVLADSLGKIQADQDRPGLEHRHIYTERPVVAAIKSVHISRVRNDARILYEVLIEKWNCDAHNEHTAMLRLDTHHRMTGGSKFNLFLQTYASVPAWQESEVRIGPWPNPPTPKAPGQNPPGLIVDRVCVLVSEIVRHHPCKLRLYVQKDCLWYEQTLGESNISRGSQDPVPLIDTLGRAGAPLSETLTRKIDKCRLQVLLANSFLYFYQSHWAGSDWAKEHIHFCRTKVQGHLDITRPYLSASCGDIHSNRERKLDMRMRKHPCPGILALGILLLEIELGHPVECYRADDNPNNGEAEFCIDADLPAAWNMLKRCKDEGNSSYHFIDAVTACILPDDAFEDSISVNVSLDNQQLLQIYCLIVARVEAALNGMFGERVEELDEIVACGKVTRISECLSVLQVQPYSRTTSLPSKVTEHYPRKLTKEKENAIFYADDESDEANSPSKKSCAGAADLWLEHLYSKVVKPLLDHQDKGKQICRASDNIFPPKGPIRIAILDTGIALPEDAKNHFGSRVQGFKSWLKYSAACDTDLVQEPSDYDGHGTHAAGLLLQVARTADIYVAQVFKDSEEVSDARMSQEIHERIAAAIKHATEVWEVDIISMSFGFESAVSVIETAIKLADANNVILVAAASNCGGNARVSWPARRDDVLCIFATDDFGNPCRSTPTPRSNKDNFAVLGHAVSSFWPNHLRPDETTVRKSGTSIATPIAAGIAAIVLQYMKQALNKWDYVLTEDKVQTLGKMRTTAGMRTIFKRIALEGEKRQGYDYLVPWNFLSVYQEATICDQVLNDLKKM